MTIDPFDEMHIRSDALSAAAKAQQQPQLLCTGQRQMKEAVHVPVADPGRPICGVRAREREAHLVSDVVDYFGTLRPSLGRIERVGNIYVAEHGLSIQLNLPGSDGRTKLVERIGLDAAHGLRSANRRSIEACVECRSPGGVP